MGSTITLIVQTRPFVIELPKENIDQNLKKRESPRGSLTSISWGAFCTSELPSASLGESDFGEGFAVVAEPTLVVLELPSEA